MAAITSQWRRRLVNIYEGKADMVCLQCNNCVIHTRAFQRRASHNGVLYKSIFLLVVKYLIAMCIKIRLSDVSSVAVITNNINITSTTLSTSDQKTQNEKTVVG